MPIRPSGPDRSMFRSDPRSIRFAKPMGPAGSGLMPTTVGAARGPARRFQNSESYRAIRGDRIGIPNFPANREDNREFASFSAVRAHHCVNFCSNSSMLTANSRPDRNREFLPGKQGTHRSEQGIYRSACRGGSTGGERSAARLPGFDVLILLLLSPEIVPPKSMRAGEPAAAGVQPCQSCC
jgi:hypothetical protein